MTMPPQGYQPYTPSFPSMGPTASQFNYRPPPRNDLQTIMGGLHGTGSTFGLPWQAGYTAQPGITTPMTGDVGPLNPGGVNPHPYGPVTPPVTPPVAGGGGVPGLDVQGQFDLNSHNNLRSKLGLPPIGPGSPEYTSWLQNRNRMPSWAEPADRSGGGIAGGRGGYPGGHGGSFAGGSGGGDIGAGSHGGHPTY
jgi:hypothetical protein